MNGQAITVTIFNRNLCALFNLLINLLLRLNRMYITFYHYGLLFRVIHFYHIVILNISILIFSTTSL